MSFWKLLGNNVAESSLATALDARKAGADWKTVGFASGIGAIGGLLQSLLARQEAQHPAVQAAAVAAVTPKP